eukprot:2429003-Amphidinium_carterae.1
MRYLHVQQLQSDGELNIHKVSTENNPSDLMMKYLETAKIKKHSETLRLHPYLGNRSVNMITRGQLRPRGSYATRPRGTTPQPRQRLRVYKEENMGNDFFQPKIEDELTGQEYFAEEVAREDDINYYNEIEIENKDVKDVIGFNKLLQYGRQLLRLLLSIGRLCDDWRRRPIQGTLHFVQQHEQDLKHISINGQRLYCS